VIEIAGIRETEADIAKWKKLREEGKGSKKQQQQR